MFYMYRYKQSCRLKGVFGTYNSLPEDEPSGSKHVEDIKSKN